MANIQITEEIQLTGKISPFKCVSGLWLCAPWLILYHSSIIFSDVTCTTDISSLLFREFYTGWLTHWGESIATTDASSTAKALKSILCRNGSAVLYVCNESPFFTAFHLHFSFTNSIFHEICFQMAHGGTNFGFYNGANTGQTEFEYKADLTSYDYASTSPNQFFHFLNHFWRYLIFI